MLQCVRSVLLWLLCIQLDMRCRQCGLWYLLLSVCFISLCSWIAVTVVLFGCLGFDDLWLLTYACLVWHGSSYDDNANGINWLTTLNTCGLIVCTVRQTQTARGLCRQLIWLVVVTCGAVGLWTWNATANAIMWSQWCCSVYVLCCCDCCVFS